MKIRSIIESTFVPAGHPQYKGPGKSQQNRYFQVVDSFPIYHRGESRTTPGDEIHTLAGGNFLVRDGKVVIDSFIPLTDPDESEGTHHEYRNSPSQFNQRRFNQLVDRGSIEEISKNDADIPRSYR